MDVVGPALVKILAGAIVLLSPKLAILGFVLGGVATALGLVGDDTKFATSELGIFVDKVMTAIKKLGEFRRRKMGINIF